MCSFRELEGRYVAGAAKGKVSWVWVLTRSGEEIAVNDCDVTFGLVDYVEATDVRIPCLARGGLSGYEADAVETAEQA